MPPQSSPLCTEEFGRRVEMSLYVTHKLCIFPHTRQGNLPELPTGVTLSPRTSDNRAIVELFTSVAPAYRVNHTCITFAIIITTTVLNIHNAPLTLRRVPRVRQPDTRSPQATLS